MTDNDVAVPVIIRHVSCPYCGRVFSIMTLGALRPRVDPNPIIYDGKGTPQPNPMFRETHIGNPIRCPACGRQFIAFVGVEYDDSSRSVRNVHVRISGDDEAYAKELMRWPHRGLVDPMVIEYRPFQILLYKNMEHFLEYNEGDVNIAATSLPSNGLPFRPEGEGAPIATSTPTLSSMARGNGQYPPPVSIDTGLKLKRRYLSYLKSIFS